MKLAEINWNPTKRQLRQFAVICLFVLPLLGWFWGGGFQVVLALALAGLILAATGIVVPAALRPLFLVLTMATTPIGVIVGELTMFLVYFGVFLPIGFLFRLANRDPLRMRFDAKAATYWQRKKQPTDPASYYRQS